MVAITEEARVAAQVLAGDMASGQQIRVLGVTMGTMVAATTAEMVTTEATETKETALMPGMSLVTWLRMVTEAIPILVTPAMVAMQEVTQAMVAMEELMAVTTVLAAMEMASPVTMALAVTEITMPATTALKVTVMLATKMAHLVTVAAKVAIPDSTEDMASAQLTPDPVMGEMQFKLAGLLQAGKS